MKTSSRLNGVQLLNARFANTPRFLALLFSVVAWSIATQAQSNYEVPYVFTTIAGSPAGGSTDGAGSVARFSSPKSIALDALGNSYVADVQNNTIRKISTAGVVTTFAGLAGTSGSADGAGNTARFNSPNSVAVDGSGNVYVADTLNYTIRKITSAGVVSTFAGSVGVSGSVDDTESAARFNRPSGVAVDGSGNVYVADTGNNIIRKITSSGEVTTLAGLVGASGSVDGTGGAARFNAPVSVTVDGTGNVYVADSSSHLIRKITSAGVVSTLAGMAGNSGSTDSAGGVSTFYNPTGVSADVSGNVYVADFQNHTIRKITTAGVVTTFAGVALNSGSADGISTDARFYLPSGLVVDGAGNVYVADSYNNVIRKITSGGDVTTFAGLALTPGSSDGIGSGAKFNYPSGVALDSAGNVYVADSSNCTIRKITGEGVVTTLAGVVGVFGSADGTGGAANFSLPQDVAVDSGGNVYVADFVNCTIRKITPGGAVSTFAGSAGLFGSTNGMGTNARFGYVNGVAVDGLGNVYVADTYHSLIRKITAAGMVTTFAGSSGSGSSDGAGSAAKFKLPRGVAADASGNVFVADSENHTIRKITPAGAVTTLAGSVGLSGSADGTGSVARFNYPKKLAVDGAGNVFVVDNSHTIRRITPAGEVTTLAGTVGQSGASDGTGSSALFNVPFGLAVDSAGALYVADAHNHTIRKGTPTLIAPIITTQPVDQTVTAGSSVTLTATATGSPAPSFQWRKNGVDVSGANSASFTFSVVQLSDAGTYTVVASNSVASSISNGAVLTVNEGLIAPVIASLSPTRSVLISGQNLNLNVTAVVTGVPSYQWYHNGRSINGATASSYAVGSVSAMDSGWYVVAISNAYGTTRSTPIFVTVAPTRTQVRGWGGEGWGNFSAEMVTNIPPALIDIIALDAGVNRVIALKRDGTVIGWGNVFANDIVIPAGLSSVVALANGLYHSLALKSDGTVVAWGSSNASGELNVPAGLTNVVAIAAGGYYSLALKSDGTVVGWGNDGSSSSNVPVGLTGVVAIAAGALPLALKNDGTVVTWGFSGNEVPISIPPVVAISIYPTNFNSAFFIGLKSDGGVISGPFPGQPGLPGNLSGMIAVSAGGEHSLMLRSDGTVFGWGADHTYDGAATPPSDLANVWALSAGNKYSLALRDGSNDTTPVIITQPVGQTVAEEQTVTLTVAASGAGPLTYQWRKNGNNLPGATLPSLALLDAPLSAAGNYDVVVTNYLGSTASAVAALVIDPVPVVTTLSPSRQLLVPGQMLTLNVTAIGSGALGYQWVHNGRVINGATGNSFSVASVALSDNGWYMVLITDSYGTRRSAPIFVSAMPVATQVRGWGNSEIDKINIPDGLTDSIALSSSSYHSLALKRDGTVVGWGQSYYGETTPTGLYDIVAVAIGASHSLALKSDGTVVAWGQNLNGQTSVPAGLVNVVAISAGGDQSLALKSDGTVVAWGTNYNGNPPVGLSDVVAITSGAGHSVALKGDGTVAAWGSNYYNQTDIPVGLSNVVAIVAGDNHSLALKTDGTVVAWGYNSDGQTSVPEGLTDAVAVAAGYNHSIALRSNGAFTGWGNNAHGQYTMPTDVANVLTVSAGNYFSLALCDATLPSAPVISTHPFSQSVGIDGSVTFTVIADGYPKPTYQWQKNGVSIIGATSSLYTIASVGSSDAASYTVVVTNPSGSVTSLSATLEAFVAPPGDVVITITVE